MATPYSSNPLLPFGSLVLTISGITYVVEGPWDVQRPTRKIRRNNTFGDQSDVMFRSEPSTVKAKLQLANSTTTVPFVGVTFSGPDGTAGIAATVAWLIHEANVAYPQGEIWYTDVTCESVVLPTD